MNRRVLPVLCLAFAATTAHCQKKLPIPTVPKGFKVTIYARPPQVNYPVCLTAAPTGEVFVGIDKQGSLGKKKGDGRVERCIDTNGDGVADKFNTFAFVPAAQRIGKSADAAGADQRHLLQIELAKQIP